ncbi:hypothetical protein DMB92_04480 [Campylobacter sp. MIT 99-7217]|uniref:flagellar FLiS export co-chaperone n=1 Tax=Campylobacter sp. MIT 99-7217 TaxID=535091 RepID=UPI001157CD0F|nr:flagellar FLiS export co-chaperone [Campylobacter sp. MIT 99-7217]TQR32360.1 hypothetical protein DMB92_04480 [Campylobacter sp. MIT 99-7217]
MSKELEIFKKHLGEVEGKSEFKAKQFCSQISDANDFIGALQILDLNLKKVLKNLNEHLASADLVDENQKRMLDVQASQLIQTCSFMGENLYDSSFKVSVGNESFSFEIQNPLLVLEHDDFSGVISYIEDKREEIASLLVNLATAITLNTPIESLGSFDTQMDYKSLFR